MNDKYLFYFTLGPVQSFIAQAKKTHDLFAGSMLLSTLCREGIDKARSNPGWEIIMPNFETEKVPNRFVAKIDASISHDLKGSGQQIEDAVKNRLLKEIPPEIINNPNSILQIQSLLEVFWLFIPIEKDDYYKAYNDGDKLLGAIKNIRVFSQISDNGETGRKCIVDGERNVVIYRKTKEEKVRPQKLYNTDVIIVEYEEAKNKEVNIWDLQPGEGLSAVSYLKRKFFRAPHSFLSTAGIALKHISNKFPIEYEACEAIIKKHLNHSNDQLLYKDNFKSKILQQSGFDGNEELFLSEFKEKIELLENVSKAEDQKFLKYFAIINFDGDFMGEWFSGDNLQNKSKLEMFHRLLSKKISEFSVQASTFLNQNGQTIYAGEDFLGFVNLTDLFGVITYLHELWMNIVSIPITTSKSLQVINRDKITFSAGIIIAHYKEPLNFVLKAVRESAELAKRHSVTKNAFRIGVLKHSGSEIGFTYDFESGALSYINAITEQLKNNFSGSFISKFIKDIYPLGTDLPEEFIEAELARIVSRSCMIVQDENETEIQYHDRKGIEIRKVITALEMLRKIRSDTSNQTEIENFTHTLALIDFYIRKMHR